MVAPNFLNGSTVSGSADLPNIRAPSILLKFMHFDGETGRGEGHVCSWILEIIFSYYVKFP